MSDKPLFVIEHTPHADRVGSLGAAAAFWLEHAPSENRLAAVVLKMIDCMSSEQQQHLAVALNITAHEEPQQANVQLERITRRSSRPFEMTAPAWIDTPEVVQVLKAMANDPEYGLNAHERACLLTASLLLTA